MVVLVISLTSVAVAVANVYSFYNPSAPPQTTDAMAVEEEHHLSDYKYYFYNVLKYYNHTYWRGDVISRQYQ